MSFRQVITAIGVSFVMAACAADGDTEQRLAELADERDELAEELDEAHQQLDELAHERDELAEELDKLREEGTDDDAAANEADSEAARERGDVIRFLGIDAEPARAGDWEVAVGNPFCNNGLGDRDDPEEALMADGQFCTIEVEATNVGNEPASDPQGNFELVDRAGRSFRHDSDASVELTWAVIDDPDIGLTNPEQTVEFFQVFDLPRESVPERVHLDHFGDTADFELPNPKWNGHGEPDWDQ